VNISETLMRKPLKLLVTTSIGGIHKYTCIVSNTQGTDQMMISTNVTGTTC